MLKCKRPNLGFGLMRLPVLGEKLSDINMNHFTEMVDIYLNEGIGYFDTSLSYHSGYSEIALKKAVSMRFSRNKYLLADKISIRNIKKEEELEQIFKMQLRKTGVDYFDNYLIHALNGDLYKKCLNLKVFEFLNKLKKEGKVKNIGFSYHGSFTDYTDILDNNKVDFVQLQINYYDFEENEARKFYNYAYEKNIPIIVMEPIRGGTLTNIPLKVEDELCKNNLTISYASLALRYVLSLPGVITVLSGMSHVDQIIENIAIVKNQYDITDKEKNAIKIIVRYLKSIPTTRCTNCRYCYKCPVDIPIYEIFNSYNKYCMNKNKIDDVNIKIIYSAIDRCISCGHCSEVCPQNINIQKVFNSIRSNQIKSNLY